MTPLDRLEHFFTNRRWDKKRPPRWVTVLFPGLLLRPDEIYCIGLYLRRSVLGGMSFLAIFLLIQIVVVLFFWHDSPALFRPYLKPYWLKAIAAHLKEGIFFIVSMPLYYTLLSLVFDFPTFYFWNRRAARLQSQPLEYPTPRKADPTVWPPPPSIK